MTDFNWIPPFVLGEEPWIWRSAPAFQFLRLLKLLGVDQQCVANFLQVTTSSVSMWSKGHRSIPGKYRPALRAYAETMLTHALHALEKETKTFPDALRNTAMVEFVAMLHRWRLEVEYATGMLHQTIQEASRQIGVYGSKESLTVEERHQLMTLCRTIQGQLRTLDELETPPKQRNGETSSDDK